MRMWLRCLCVFWALVLCSCAAKSDIQVGFVASLSGVDHMLGIEGRNAAMLYVDDINSRGGIAGHKLRLVVRDIASDDSRAPLVAQELVDEGVAVIIGYYSSSSALKALPVVQQAGLPIISPTSTSAELSGKDDCFFRTIMTSARDPVVLGNYMKQMEQRRVLFIAAAYNKPYYETYLNGLRPLVSITGPVFYQTLDTLDWQGLEELSQTPGFDAVMIVASALDSGTIAQKLSLAGIHKPVYLSGWAGNTDVLTYGAAAVEGALFTHQVDLARNAGYPLVATYREAFGSTAGYGATETWDSFLLLAEAIKRIRGKPERLLQSLREIREFQGTAELIRMDEFGDARRPLYIKRIESGRFNVIGSED